MSEAELQALVKSIQELRESQKETERAIRALAEGTDRELKTSALERDRAIKESAEERDWALKESAEKRDRAINESAEKRDRALNESAEKRDRALNESAEKRDRALNESADRTDEAIRKFSGMFSSQWGDLVEALVEPNLVSQFQARGVPITQKARRVEGVDRKGRQVEIDVLLMNGDTAVAIEVKSKCKVDDIDDYEETLGRFKEAFPRYAEGRVLAGIAAVVFDSDCDRYAYKRGMYVLKPIEGVAQILNDEGFTPKEF